MQKKVLIGLFTGMLCLYAAPYSCADEPQCMEATRMVQEGADLGDGSEKERSLYRKAIEICPKVAEAHHNLGVLFLHDGDLEAAAMELEKAIALRDAVEYRLALAHILMKQDKVLSAASEYEAVLEKERRNVKALQGLSVIMSQKGDYKSARDYLEKALEKSSTDEISLFNRAVIAEKIESPDKAEEFYKELLRVNPAHRQGVLRYGLLLRTANRLVETQSLLQQALRTLKEDEEFERLFAATSEELGDYDGAEVAYKKLLGTNPLDEEALVSLASVYLRKRQHQLCLETISKILAINNENARACTVQGIAYLQLGRYEQAEKSLQKAILLDPSSAVAYYNLGLIFEHKGEEEKAIQSKAKARALEPSLVD